VTLVANIRQVKNLASNKLLTIQSKWGAPSDQILVSHCHDGLLVLHGKEKNGASV
jgi:hypothetical protein